MNWLRTRSPGMLLVTCIAAFSTWLGMQFAVVGGAVFGILIGMVIGNIRGIPLVLRTGIQFSSKIVLQGAIVILGCGLSLTQVWKTGKESFIVMILTLLAAFIATYVFGKLLKIPARLQALIGVGTAICGGSAIAAVAPVVEAEETEIAYAISTIFIFNVAAVLIFPPMGHLIGFSDQAFGLWAGTAINDTSSVVAAGYIYSDAAGAYATIVKLTRTVMIVPIVLIFAFIITARKRREFQINGSSTSYSFRKVFPWFICWFLVASCLNTAGLFSDQVITVLEHLGKFMIVAALTAIGLSANIKKMINAGTRPILLGLIVWVIVALVSIILQYITGEI